MVEKKQKTPIASSNYMTPVLFGVAIIFLTFGVAGGWAAIAPIASAVVAPGVVAIENNRKVVQHLEGGIISEIYVVDGHMVDKGDLLFRIDPTQAKARATQVRQQLYAARVQEARLLAERDGQNEIDFPEDLLALDQDSVVRKAIADEQKQFNERKASIDGQISILRSRMEQAQTRIDGLNQELESTREQIGFVNKELVAVRSLHEKGLVSSTRLNQLERERAQLEGIIGRTTAEISGAQVTMGESELQIRQIRQERLEKAAEQITEIRRTINELKENLIVSSDILQRTEIRAPRSGTIINLAVFTKGQVIRAGDTLLEIVPEDEGLIINAQVSTTDIDNVHPGMTAEVRFPAFKARQTPVIFGEVRDVSADRLIDEQTRQPYFLARVSVANEDVPKHLRGRITAGMPGDVILPTGERTVLEYLLNPMETALTHAFTEE